MLCPEGVRGARCATYHSAMYPIRKKILTDEAHRAVAVQIEYADWLEVERLLGQVPAATNGVPATDLNRFSGVLSLREDPMAFQERMRGEWS